MSALIPNKPSFTLEEVAELTSFPKRVLQDACRRGRIRHQHLGRQRTLTRDQLLELLASTEEGQPTSQRQEQPPKQTPRQQRIDAARQRALTRVRGRAS